MPKVTPLLSNFTAGELSPLLDGRTDISRYYNGAKTLENYIPLPQGGLKRRPGTYYVAATKSSSKLSRLMRFQFSTTQAYQIEAGDRYMRFYANHGQILSSGSAYEITTPYLESDIRDIQFAQDADTMWLVHPSYKPRELTRTVNWDSYTKLMLHCDGTDASQTFTDEIGKTINARGTAQIDTAQYKFGGASGLFDGDSDYLDTADSDDWYFNTGDFTIDFWIRSTDIIPAAHQYLFSQGTAATNLWAIVLRDDGKLELEVWDTGVNTISFTATHSMSDSTWHHVALVRASGVFTFYVDGSSIGTSSDADALPQFASSLYIASKLGAGSYFGGWLDEIRISKGIARWTSNFTVLTSAYSADQPTFTLKNYAPELLTLDVAPGGSGWAAGDTITGQTSGVTSIIVSVTDATHYRIRNRSGAYTLGEVLTNGTDTADQGAANPVASGDPFGADGSDDCPSCVSIHEQRLCFAATNNDPQKIWGSVSGDYQDMTTGSDDDDAFAYTIGAEEVNAIRWLSSGRVLGLGTFGGVFSLSSGSDNTPITPSNVTVKRETTYGSLGLVPKKIGNFVYYLQRNGRTIREFGYSYDIDEYTSFDTQLLAEHIAEGGIVEMDYQQSPYNLLWCVRADGQLLAMTRQIDQEVLAWSRHILGGNFDGGDAVVESVSIIPGDDGDDEVWLIVKRTINSATARYVEYLKPFDYGDEQEDAFFVDCGLTLDNPKTITGISKTNPGVVTSVGHGFSNDDIVIIRGVVGMTEVNQTKYKVANKTDDTFELTDADTGDDIDTSDYTTYSSGGEVRKCNTSVTGASHLNGETVDIFIDGDTGTTGTVSGGTITITTPSNGGGEIHAGLRYTPYLRTMRIEAGSALGTAQSKLKRISKVFTRLYETLKLKVGNDITQDEFDFRPVQDTSSSMIDVYSGDLEVPMPSVWDRDAYVIVTQDGPYPSNIIAIIIYLTVSDGY